MAGAPRQARLLAALIAPALAGAAPVDTPTTPPPAADPAAEKLAFVPDPSRLTLAVHVGEAGPYRFVVDTGAERTIISSTIAGSLALAPGRPLRVITVAGTSTVTTAMIPSLRMSAQRSMRDVTAPVLERADIGADGMLGLDALKGRTVMFDFRNRAMTIGREHVEQSQAFDEIVVTARSSRGRLVFGDGRVERVATSVVLDTGAEVTIGNPALRRALAAKRRIGQTYIDYVTTITGERVPVEMLAVRALDLGGVSLHAMPVAFADSPIFAQLGLEEKPALLLGMDALKLFDRVAVDFGARRVRFRV